MIALALRRSFTRSLFVAAAVLALLTPAHGQADLGADLETIRAKYHLPGLSAMAVKDGHILAQGAAGVRRVGDASSLLVDDQVNIGSCTKWMTATIAGRLVDRGVISWNTRIRDSFSESATFNPAFANVTLDQLLAHVGGVQQGLTFESRHWSQLQAQGGTVQQIRRWVCDTVLTEAPEVSPGTYLYSNQGYDVAAAMLEIASGKSWETLIQEEIFTPAGMTATLGQVDDGQVPPKAPAGHDLASGATTATVHQIMDTATVMHYQASNAPGGFTACSLQNWAKFLHLYTASGAGGYLSADTRAHLKTAYSGAGTDGYGRGVFAVTRSWAGSAQALNHGGDIFSQNTVFWMAPAKDFIAVVFTNVRAADDSVTANGLDEVAGLLINRYADAAADGPLLSTPAALPVASMSATTPKTTVGGAPGVITVSLSAPAPAKLTVKYTLGGTGVNGTDYQTLGGKLKFAAGQSSADVQIIGQGNLGGASKKTVLLTLLPNKNYTVGTTKPAKVKIIPSNVIVLP